MKYLKFTTAALAVLMAVSAAAAEKRTTKTFSFSLSPNPNVNNGSDNDYINLYGLPFKLSPDAKALSGYEVSGGFNITHKISETRRNKTFIGFSGFGRTYELDGKSAKAAPNVKGSDFSFVALELFGRHSWVHKLANGPASVRLNLGKNWYGGKQYRIYSNLGVSQEWRLKNGVGLSFGVGHQRQIIHTDKSMANVVALRSVVLTPLTETGRFKITFEAEKTFSTLNRNDNTAARLHIDYKFRKPVFGTRLSLGLKLEKIDYGISPYDADGRHDGRATAKINLLIPKIKVKDFYPVIQLEAQRTVSNIALYDRTAFGMNFKFVRTF